MKAVFVHHHWQSQVDQRQSWASFLIKFILGIYASHAGSFRSILRGEIGVQHCVASPQIIQPCATASIQDFNEGCVKLYLDWAQSTFGVICVSSKVTRVSPNLTAVSSGVNYGHR